MERLEKLDQKIEKLEKYLIKKIVQLQFKIGAKDPKFVLEMDVTSN